MRNAVFHVRTGDYRVRGKAGRILLLGGGKIKKMKG